MKIKSQSLYFQHMYLKSGFNISAKYTKDGKPYKAPKTHACLYFGYWCWSNAIQNPKMALRYIKRVVIKK